MMKLFFKKTSLFILSCFVLLITSKLFGQQIPDLPLLKNSEPYLYRSFSYASAIKKFSNYNWKFVVGIDGQLYYWNKLIPGIKYGPFVTSPLGTELAQFDNDGALVFYDLIKFTRMDELSLKSKKEKVQELQYDGLGQVLFAVTESGNLFRLVGEGGKNQRNMELLSKDFFVSSLVWNSNLSSFLIADDRHLFYLNPYDGKTTQRKTFESDISALAISPSRFLIANGLTSGSVFVFNQDYTQEKFDIKVASAAITSLVFHERDHYLFAGDELGNVYVIDVLKKKIIYQAPFHSGPVQMSMVKNFADEYFLATIGGDNLLKLWNMNYLEPDYNLFLNERVTASKEFFMKRRQGENAGEYALRTNVDSLNSFLSRKKQGLVDSIGRTKQIGNSASILVKSDTINAFIPPFSVVKIPLVGTSPSSTSLMIRLLNFELSNENTFIISKLSLKDSDGNIFNYGFQHIIKTEEPEIPLELVRKVANEEFELKEELQNIVEEHRSQGQLNNMELGMDALLKKEKDSLGRDEMNLHISYIARGIKAEAEKNTSDYPSGRYNLFDSKAATTLVDFFIKSVEEKLSEYLLPETRVTFKLTGSTDKIKVTSKIPYKNEFGGFKNFPFYFQGALSGMNLNPEQLITENSELGFLRTYAVRQFLESQTSTFEMTKNKFIHYSEEADAVGPEHRKIKIEVIIHAIDKNANLKTNASPSAGIVPLSTLVQDIPERNNNAEAYALIIGNEDYSSFQTGLSSESNVPYAANDADVVKAYFLKMFKVNPTNLFHLVNATYAEMNQAILKLERILEIDGADKEVFFYYSGHGMPDEQTKEPYLIPVDVSGMNVSNGIPLKGLIQRLSTKPHIKLTLLIDACFSGAARAGQLAQLKGITVTPKNPEIGDNTILLSSSSGNESSIADPDKQHGLMTFYLLKHLKENAGNTNWAILGDEIKRSVSLEAIKRFNKIQTPSVLMGKNIVSSPSSTNFFNFRK